MNTPQNFESQRQVTAMTKTMIERWPFFLVSESLQTHPTESAKMASLLVRNYSFSLLLLLFLLLLLLPLPLLLLLLLLLFNHLLISCLGTPNLRNNRGHAENDDHARPFWLLCLDQAFGPLCWLQSPQRKLWTTNFVSHVWQLAAGKNMRDVAQWLFIVVHHNMLVSTRLASQRCCRSLVSSDLGGGADWAVLQQPCGMFEILYITLSSWSIETVGPVDGACSSRVTSGWIRPNQKAIAPMQRRRMVMMSQNLMTAGRNCRKKSRDRGKFMQISIALRYCEGTCQAGWHWQKRSCFGSR